MRVAASSISNPAAGVLDGAGALPSAKVRARRAKQRRQMLGLVGVSYVVDAVLLMLYGYAGSIPANVGPAFGICGLGSVACFIALSEAGINDRFGDHYFVVQQSVVSLAIMLAFAWLAPDVGVLFLCTLFIVFSFSALRSTPRQTAIAWTAMALGLAALFLLTDKPIAIPHQSYLERFVTMLAFTLTIGRCMFLGIFASSLRESLYKRGLQLKEAYKRIEELAELDELTGAFNRRCIMRMLDDEIARAQRNRTPFSVALIDLDWFKRINDAYGHPTGDEVLRTFAITIFANIRAIDRFGRYGGEEFLLILPDTTRDSAARILDRQRDIIASLDWSAFSPGMNVTISAGVAALGPNEAADALLARADSALYKAKAQGRNRIATA
jgi:diguanylate cyclase (GGDEF)-like protein